MKAVTKAHQLLLNQEITVKQIEEMNCLEVRKTFDELFDEGFQLENTPAMNKRRLFMHLEICQNCCHSLDVRIKWRTPSRRRLL